MSTDTARVKVSEICKDLQIGYDRAYEMLERKIIPNVKIGRNYLVTRRAYENWKETCGTPAARQAVG